MRASRLFLFCIFTGLGFLFSIAQAQEEPASDMSKAQHRLYPGGRDEQNIEIQPVLAQPSRSLLGSSVLPSKPAAQDDEPSAPTEPPEVD
jgi:hypothetical protein